LKFIFCKQKQMSKCWQVLSFNINMY
jgi:hypothetical protein